MSFDAEGFGGVVSVPYSTQNAGTVITALVPPKPGLVYKLVSGAPNWYGNGRTRLTTLNYTSGSTAHTITVLRPTNWAVVDGAVANNATVITLKTDPGLYATKYKYPLPNGATKPAAVADNAIAGSDYVAYQLKDGVWVLDKVASVSGLAVTMTTGTPNVSGGGIDDGQILFFFGVAADSNPYSGAAHFAMKSTASTNRVNLIGDYVAGGLATYFRGDPMMIYSDNSSNAGIFDGAFGCYTRD